MVQFSRLFQKLLVALMHGNCALFNNRVPSTEAGLTLQITSTKCTHSECNARLHQTNPSLMCTYVINVQHLETGNDWSTFPWPQPLAFVLEWDGIGIGIGIGSNRSNNISTLLCYISWSLGIEI